jgi:M6 family metalloprotease-like protein
LENRVAEHSHATHRRTARPLSLRSIIVVALLAAGSFACGGGGDSSPTTPNPQSTPVLTTLSVSLAPSTIQVGQTATATAAGRDQFGASIATGTVTWSSSSPQVATVNESGSVIGVSAGQSTITAAVGGLTASAPVVVSASDLLAECRLPAKFSDIGLGLPRVANRQKATGDVGVAMVFVDFSDAIATRTPQNVFAIISPIAENYFRAVSYGRMNLILEPTFVWRRMSKPTTAYGWNALTFDLHRAYIQEALNLASSVDFSQSDAFLIVSNPDAGALNNGPTFIGAPGFGVTAGGKTLLNGSTSGRDLIGWGAYWLNHEMGHSMGLVDLYAYTGAAHRFVGGFSIMGLISGHAREYFGWERWLLGWVDDNQVSCAPAGTSEVVLAPVERAGGTKIVVIPTGANSAVVAESRRAEGYDTNGTFTPGVLVYLIDTSIRSGAGVLKVLPINDSDSNKGTAPLQPGGSLTLGAVTVSFLSQNASGDRVRVVR